jgi:prevent-host-death family protein
MERKVNVTTFKARCLSMLDEVERGETTIVLTRNGAPIARVVPFAGPAPMTGSVEFLVDDDELLEPVDARWEAAG